MPDTPDPQPPHRQEESAAETAEQDGLAASQEAAIDAAVQAADNDTADASGSGSEPTKRPKVVLCPYCGQTQQPGNKCVNCGGLFEPLSRRATQIAMGPWTIRDKARPFRPGCSYEVLVKMIDAGRITPTTVLRGPTTRQFWSIARNVPGVAHLLGYCHQCGQHTETDPPPQACPNCNAKFRRVRQRNELGLQFPTRKAAEAAQRSLNRALGIAPTVPETPGGSDDEPEKFDPQDEALLENETQQLVAAASAGGSAHATPESIFDNDDTPAAGGEAHDLIGDVLAEEAAAAPAPKPSRSAGSKTPRPETPPAETPTPPNPAALPPRQQINWVVWVLLALNVLIAAAVIYAVAVRPAAG